MSGRIKARRASEPHAGSGKAVPIENNPVGQAQGTSSPAERYAAMQHAVEFAGSEPPKSLFEGIARQLKVAATYNAMVVHFAPHVLYTRAGMLYVAGQVTARRGQPVRQPKLGIFKVDGLSEITTLEEPFDVAGDFDPQDPRYAATAIFAVEPAKK